MLSLTVAAALWLVLLGLRKNATVLIFINLPATLCHELAHWVVAMLAGCRPSLPSVVPRREDNRWVLGSVRFDVKPLSAGLVALAPPLLLAPGAWLGLNGSVLVDLPSDLLRGVLFGYLAWGALPSSTDLAIALRYPAGALVAVGTLALLFDAAI